MPRRHCVVEASADASLRRAAATVPAAGFGESYRHTLPASATTTYLRLVAAVHTDCEGAAGAISAYPT